MITGKDVRFELDTTKKVRNDKGMTLSVKMKERDFFIKNFHNYFELVTIVLESNITAFMFSALDIAYYFKNEFERVEKIVKKANEKIMFLDSGGFEKYNIPYYRKQWEIQD
ncbi:hypothetical protein LCGC14_0862380, partial [marine sediment metagenome]